jgi:hypothetical protein
MEIHHPRTYTEWLDFDFKCIQRCDAVLRMPGASKGGDAEVAFAERCGIPVYFSLEALMASWPSSRTCER